MGKHGQVNAPIAPDVASVGFHILIFVALGIPVVAQIDGTLIQEVGLAHAHPVKFGLAAEQPCRLLCEVGVILDLLCEGLVSEILAQVQAGRE